MDNITHTLFALTLARTRIGRAGRGTTAALVLASNAPDIDVLAALGGSTNYLAWHRGPTHGLLGVAGLGLVTASLVWGVNRLVRSWGPPSGGPIRLEPDPTFMEPTFKELFVVSLIGVLFHILMDVPTSYGTRLASPFAWRWYAIDLMPIIDIYLLVVLAAGLGLGSRSPDMARRSAAIVLALMAMNYGGRAFAHHEALKLTARLSGPSRPPACDAQASSISLVDAWPHATARAGSCLVEAAAIPSFLSPFQWRVIAQFPDAYEIFEVDLRDESLRSASPSADRLAFGARLPNRWTPVVVEAARTRTAQIFLGFARFPLMQVSGNPSGVATVRMTDLRFNPGFEGNSNSPLQTRRTSLFTVTVQIGPDNEIIQERLGE